MSHTEVRLNLHQPEQAKPARQSLFVSSRRFNEWLESLPLGNMTAAGNEMLTTIQEFNQTRVSPRARAEMLDRLIEPVLTVVGVLDKHSREATFPLSEKQDRIGRVATSFFKEIALGYRIAARELSADGQSVGFLAKKQVARWLFCSMAGYEQMFLRLALLYQQVPEGAWHEINTLYLFAVANDLHRKDFDSPLAPSGTGSIDAVYRRVSLFCISDPQRLGQRSVRALYQAANSWIKGCHVRHDVDIQKADPGLFEVQPKSDDPPILISSDQVPKRFAHVFDLRELRQHLLRKSQSKQAPDDEMTFRDADGKPLVIDTDLIQQLVTSWGVHRKRSFQRLMASHPLRLVVGLSAAHFVVAGECAFPHFLREYGNPRFAESASRDRARFGERDLMGGRPLHHSAEVLNQSLGGYRVRLRDLDDLQIKVGELVVVCPEALAATDPLWMVGMIRWINAIDVRELEVGISLVGRNPIPAALLVSGDDKLPPARAIALEPFDRNSGQEPFLVTSSTITGRQPLDLCLGSSHDNHCGRITLTRRIERSTEVARYRYKTSGEAIAT